MQTEDIRKISAFLNSINSPHINGPLLLHSIYTKGAQSTTELRPQLMQSKTGTGFALGALYRFGLLRKERLQGLAGRPTVHHLSPKGRRLAAFLFGTEAGG